MKDVLITSSALILALLILRRLFRKTLSRRVQYALWGLVLIRLLVPVSFPAVDFSVLTAAQPVRQAVAERVAERPVYVPVARAPRAEHPAAPDMSLEQVDFPGAESVWVARDEDTAVQYRRLSVEMLLSAIWKAGVALMGGFFALSNAALYLRLRKRRERFSSTDSVSRRVYIVPAGVLPSPCLFWGAIYLTPAAAASPDALRHVLAHEETHARHLDSLWALLRGVCLAVYWFDPFVWVAAACSKVDCEMACDEGALERLGEQERIPYGETLLSLIPVRKGLGNSLTTATTMTAGKRQLRERITRIAQKPRQLAAAVAAVLLLAVVAAGCTFTGAVGEDEPTLPSDAGSEDIVPADTVPTPSPEEETAAVERLAAVQAAEKKLAGYRWPRETVQKTIGGREVEFVLYHGSGWTMYVPDDWTQPFFNQWRSPSDNAGFMVDKIDLPVNNPKWYRAHNGSWQHETDYAPPFDYYYDDDGGYTPPEGSVDHTYFFAPAGEKSYELCLMVTVGMATDEERAMQEVMLLSFTQDESFHVLQAGEYKPGESQWDAAMAGLVAEGESLWLSWEHDGKITEADGKGRPEYFSYAQALTEFRPEEFTQTLFGERPEGVEILDGDSITICLPELWIWLCFYEDSPWVYIHHAGEDFWARLHRSDVPEAFAFDAARAWMEAEQAWANG